MYICRAHAATEHVKRVEELWIVLVVLVMTRNVVRQVASLLDEEGLVYDREVDIDFCGCELDSGSHFARIDFFLCIRQLLISIFLTWCLSAGWQPVYLLLLSHGR